MPLPMFSKKTYPSRFQRKVPFGGALAGGVGGGGGGGAGEGYRTAGSNNGDIVGLRGGASSLLKRGDDGSVYV